MEQISAFQLCKVGVSGLIQFSETDSSYPPTSHTDPFKLATSQIIVIFFFWNRKTVKLWFVATYISQAMAKACKQQPVNDDKRANLVILAS